MDREKSDEVFVSPRAFKPSSSADFESKTVEVSVEDASFSNDSKKDRQSKDEVQLLSMNISNVSLNEEIVQLGLFFCMVYSFFRVETIIHKLGNFYNWLKIGCHLVIALYSNNDWRSRLCRLKDLLTTTGEVHLMKQELPSQVENDQWLKLCYTVACGVADSFAIRKLVLDRTVLLLLTYVCHSFIGTEEFVYTSDSCYGISDSMTEYLSSKTLIVQAIQYCEAVGPDYECPLKLLRGVFMAMFIVGWEIYNIYRTWGPLIRLIIY